MKKAVLSTILLALACLCLPLWAEIPCVWTGVERVVAVGDLHGDYASFVIILKETKVVDAELHWAAGSTHLVQTGDILDRGPEARRIFDLLINLEREAQAAGGRVHFLIGNHEELNLVGIAFSYPDYVTVEQFKDFLPDDYRKKREAQFLKRWRALQRSVPHNSVPSDEEYRSFWQDVLASDTDAHERYIQFLRRHYGAWIAQHNAVIKINETVFVHGGISLKYSLMPLVKINDLIRSELREVMAGREFEPKYLFARDGPLWYRGLAEESVLSEQEVDRILANLNASHIVVAHTVWNSPSKPMRRLGGKVWAIDTGISAYYAGYLSALIINGDHFQTWGVNDGQK